MSIRLQHSVVLWSAVVLTAACESDSGFTKLTDPEPPAEDTSVPPVEVESEVEPEPDPECPNRIYPGQVTNIDESCLTEPSERRYEPVVEWTMETFETFPERGPVGSRMAVGHLTDDNGDGAVGTGDVPDIVAFTRTPNADRSLICHPVTRLISGDGTLEHWVRDSWEVVGRPFGAGLGTSPALGDVDLDGEPEIVLHLVPRDQHTDVDFEDGGDCIYYSYVHSGVDDCALGVLSAEGELEQVIHGITCESHSPTLADIDSDGTPDILHDLRVFQGTDLAELTLPFEREDRGAGGGFSYWTGGIPVPADLDGDGLMEVIAGTHIQEWDGRLRCTTDLRDGWPAVADLDGDGDGEIVVSGSSAVQIFDHNCGLIDAWPLEDDGRGGPPTIADYDGDGVPEIGLPSKEIYMAYELDGTLKWTTPVRDGSSNCTGSAVFDFEEDGYAEVVYADEVDLWIISGYSGRPLLRYRGHSSGTDNEYPLIVDVDGDGETEILHAGNFGIYVLGSIDGWAPSRPVWNQHAYWLTNVNDDLTIPSPTPQNWPEYNSFRSGDLRVNAGQGARLVDAKPFMHDICEVECGEGTVEVALSPNNEGLAMHRWGEPGLRRADRRLAGAARGAHARRPAPRRLRYRGRCA